jgi:chromosome segregation ATPase
MTHRLVTLLALAACLGIAACQDQKKPSIVAPSTDQAGYASSYPEKLDGARAKMNERESTARSKLGTFGGYPDELDKPSWQEVDKLYDLADSAGKSSEYVESIHEAETVAGFFEDEKQEISKKVAGAAAHAAKQKGCDKVEAYGPASHALEKSVEKQLEERLRKRNEAHRYLEAHEEPLGKNNRPKLEKQVDEISFTSYVVNVGVEEEKEKLQRLVSEGNDVKTTLDRVIQENKAIVDDPNAKESQKNAAQKEIEAAEKAKQKIDQEIEQTQGVLKEIDNRIKTLREEYKKAFDELKKKVDDKKKSEPPAA